MDTESLRAFCKTLKGTTEDIKWGNDLCFCIAGKMYCVTGLHDEGLGMSFKVKDEEFEELCTSPAFIPAPYVARYKWVQLKRPDMLTDEQIKHYVRQSYELIKKALPPKLKREAGLED